MLRDAICDFMGREKNPSFIFLVKVYVRMVMKVLQYTYTDLYRGKSLQASTEQTAAAVCVHVCVRTCKGVCECACVRACAKWEHSLKYNSGISKQWQVSLQSCCFLSLAVLQFLLSTCGICAKFEGEQRFRKIRTTDASHRPRKEKLILQEHLPIICWRKRLQKLHNNMLLAVY